jgi:ABC-type dipeptide/oligopeptide/nickel transport system permease component
MSPVIVFLARRLLFVPITLLVITAVLYASTMLVPPERRAFLYLPPKTDPYDVSPESPLIQSVIEQYHLRDPFPVQYLGWLGRLLQGDWGWSFGAKQPVLPYLLARTPVTMELLLYSTLLFVPIGLLTGVLAAARRGRRTDHGVQLAAFVGTSIPVFVMAIIMLSLFYVGLHWFPMDRISDATKADMRQMNFQYHTGLLTIDGLFNGRPDITLEALHHLALPALVLAVAQWATLSRITRTSVLEEIDQDYITVAHAKGLKGRQVVWSHATRNALVPILTVSALSAAALVANLYLVEALFNFHGVSDIFLLTTAQASSSFRTFDPAPALGLAVYTVVLVLSIMLVLDVLQVLVNPHLRERLKDQ